MDPNVVQVPKPQPIVNPQGAIPNPTPPTITTPQPLPPKTNLLNKVGLIFLLTSLLLTGGYVAYQYFFNPKTKNPEEATSPQPTTNQSPKPTLSNSTTNWSLFESTKYGFSFSHPNLCSNYGDVASPLQGAPEKITVLADKNTFAENSDKPFNGFGLFVEPNTDKKTLVDYVANEKQVLTKSYQNNLNQVLKEPSQKEVLVGGQKGFLLNYEEGIKNLYVGFPNDPKILIFAVIETTKGSFDNTFNQILATFKFKEEIKQSTFTSKKIEGLSLPTFSLTYPSNWFLSETSALPQSQVITFAFDNYRLTIEQDNTKSSVCAFYDSPQTEGKTNNLAGVSFRELTTNFGSLRYYEPTETKATSIITYAFCQKKQNEYQTPLSIGKLTVGIPRSYNQSILNELLNIIKSITIK